MAAVIELQNLSKSYGTRKVVAGINLEVDAGEIFALVGPNGSGKTSILRMMATLLEPTSGSILIGGHSAVDDRQSVRRLMGYIPDDNGVYADMNVREYLDFFAGCFQISKETRANLIDDLLDLVDLGHWRDDWVETLSAGMRKRLGIARALIHDPQVLILDDPSSKLDPKGKNELYSLLAELAGMGKTIFLASQSLPDAADICSRVGVLEAGELAAVGDVGTLIEQLAVKHKIKMTILNDVENTRKLLEKVPMVSKVHSLGGGTTGKHQLEMEFVGDEVVLGQILTYLTKSGVQVIQFAADDNALERIYFSAIQG
jgi:ABC-2 type transport system ATP-binding protein